MEIEDIKELMAAVTTHGIASFKYKDKEGKVTIENSNYLCAASSSQFVYRQEIVQAVQAESKQAELQDMDADKVVFSPLVGIFYEAASPGADPYVKAGDSVKKGQVLGMIEAMKLMNEIESEFDGIIEKVLVQNEEVVEYGQALFILR